MTRVFSWRSLLPTAAAILIGSLVCIGPAYAQLRIVTYNPTGAPSASIDVVLKAIGEETRNGIARPIDILLLQEQNLGVGGAGANSPSPNTQAFVTLLNGIYGSGAYAMGNRTGAGDTTQTIVYRTATIQTIATGDQTSIANAGPRDAVRTRVRPVGYTTSAADIYIYNSHYKASQDASPPGTNANQRLDEADKIRDDSDLLNGGVNGTHVIYAGDHNFYDYDADEPAWGRLVNDAGNGQAQDPINQVGTWHNNASFAAIHTQSPCLSPVGNCGVTGGMDDRFDFQLVTGELMDSEGLSYISGSYHSFGNNGTTYNDDINDASNTVTFPGVTSYTKAQVLTALHEATDHIPVVADYQIPAFMQALAGSVPAFVEVGQLFNFNVTVSNIATVLTAIGADELDYSLSTSGSLSGSYSNQIDAALGTVNTHSISLITSSVGAKTGTITVTSTSQGVQTTAVTQNGSISIPISFQVILSGDYNNDGFVDMADYALWRNGSALQNDSTPGVQATDYDVWRANFGRTASGGAGGDTFAAAAVPEPSTLGLALIGVCWIAGRARKLRG